MQYRFHSQFYSRVKFKFTVLTKVRRGNSGHFNFRSTVTKNGQTLGKLLAMYMYNQGLNLPTTLEARIQWMLLFLLQLWSGPNYPALPYTQSSCKGLKTESVSCMCPLFRPLFTLSVFLVTRPHPVDWTPSIGHYWWRHIIIWPRDPKVVCMCV